MRISKIQNTFNGKISYATRRIDNDTITPVVSSEIKTNSQYDSQIYKTAENICTAKNSIQRKIIENTAANKLLNVINQAMPDNYKFHYDEDAAYSIILYDNSFMLYATRYEHNNNSEVIKCIDFEI